MIRRALASKLFEAFSITRWNDHIRPVEFIEMDKHALKSVLTYFIGKMEEQKGSKIDWVYIVKGNVYALLKNIALSDIKQPIITKIKDEHSKEFAELNKWVVSRYKPYFGDDSFITEFEKFLLETDESNALEFKILRAAHKYSTKREFDIIKPINEHVFPDMENKDAKFKKSMEEFTDLRAIGLINVESDFYNFLCILEQLRYQIRWSQTPRIPQTSVLGHSMYVALLTFFISLENKVCDSRLVNNFFAALFHDLPESVTRDIISPVKRATEDLPKIIKDIEHDVCAEQLYPFVPKDILPDLLYLLGDIEGADNDEFRNRVIIDNKVIWLDDKDDLSKYNSNEYNLIDGRLIKVCDEIGAYMEAYKSVEYGISSYHLQDGLSHIREKYIRDPVYGRFFIEFD